MVDASTLTFKRICIHTIEPKTLGTKTATAICDKEMTELGTEVEETLKERITSAFGHRSKALDVEISKAGLAAGTFFDLGKDLKEVSDQVFIERSALLAKQLAEAQKSQLLPGGYIMIIDAIDEFANPVVIVIKAEPHEAFKRNKSNGSNKIEVIKDLFLSKGTKLYKIVALYKQDNPEKEYPNDQWGCILFDEQFTPGDRPSSYFWNGFLKLSIDNNAKVQTAIFYNDVHNFIEKSSMPLEVKNTAFDGLETLVVDTFAQTIDPEVVKETLLAPEYRSEFGIKVQSKFPHLIIKDTSAIVRKLETRNFFFPDGIKLTGEKNKFNQVVKVINTYDDLNNLELNSDKTILVIEGKPSKFKFKFK